MDKYTELKERFERNRDEENAVNMAAYMRDLFPFYGLPTPTRRAVYKELLRAEKREKVIDWDLLDKCYADEHREFQYFVYDYLSAMSGVLVYDDISRIEKYIRGIHPGELRLSGQLGRRDRKDGADGRSDHYRGPRVPEG